MSDAFVGPGHNRPPSPTPETLAEDHADLVRRRDVLIAAADAFLAKHPTIETEQVAAAAAENLKMIVGHMKRMDNVRTVEKGPYLEAGRTVDAWFKRSTDELRAAGVRLNRPTAAYLAKVEQRNRQAAAAEAARLKQLADRAAEEARAGAGSYDNAIDLAEQARDAEQHASGSVAEHTRMTGSYGSAVRLERQWDFEVTDPAAVPRALCSPDPRLIRAAIKGGLRTIEGLRVFEVEKARIR